MKILDNLKVGQKLFVGFGLCILAILGLVFFNYFQIQSLDALQARGAKRAQNAILAGAVASEAAKLYRIIADAEINENFDDTRKNWAAEKQIAERLLAQSAAEALADDSAEEQKLVADAKASYDKAVDLFDNRMFPALLVVKAVTPDIQKLDGEVDGYITGIQTPMDSYVNLLNKQVTQADSEFDVTTLNTINLGWVVAIVVVLLASILALLVSNNITGPLSQCVVMLSELSQGHLSGRLKMERSDEIGLLTSTVDSFANDLQQRIVGTMQKIAAGDLSTEVIRKDEHDEISPALIQITTSLRGLVDETRTLTRSAINGQLTTRGDAGKFKGSYHEIVQGVNETLDAFIAPLNVGIAYVDSMAQGVVPAVLKGTYNGDFDVFKNNLNRLSERLREMLTNISDASANLTSATAEILAATTQQSSGASEQSAAISQTTTTVEEVKASSEQAAMRAQDVATASQRTVEVARSGQGSVQATIDSMAMIKERVEGISENLLALSDQTQQIGEIISTVNEIASQSNMLALNASVEAARAGEHGKGFAVVATEVRSLAEQSRQATEQIKAILSEIQKATNSTVMATEEGVKGVDRGVQLSMQSRESIEQLAAVINESAQVAAQVVASGQQQQTGIDQISLAMQNINQVTMQGLASTRQTEKSAQGLNELARKMSEILAQYRF